MNGEWRTTNFETSLKLGCRENELTTRSNREAKQFYYYIHDSSRTTLKTKILIYI